MRLDGSDGGKSVRHVAKEAVEGPLVLAGGVLLQTVEFFKLDVADFARVHCSRTR